jgi:N6-adenosine-specific RNA methylase IME4
MPVAVTLHQVAMVAISAVEVGDRHRSLDLTACRSLAASILEIGLLNPITLTKSRVLVSGLHRLRACESLGWQQIPAVVLGLDELHAELAEIDENLVRNELTALERGDQMLRRKEIYLALHPETKPVTERGGPGRGHKTTADSAPVSASFVTDAASKSGASARSVEVEVQYAAAIKPAVKALIRAEVKRPGHTPVADNKSALIAIAQQPTAAGQRAIVEKLVDGTASTVREALRQIQRETMPALALPTGPKRYRVIYADPPWQYSDSRAGLADYAQTAAEDHYPTMSVEELSALDVPRLAEPDATLFCWATFPLLPDALEVVKAWGFTYKTAFVWAKGRANFGHYHNASAELLLVCTRGSGVPDVDKREQQVQAVDRTGRHSAKPEEFRALIDRLYTHGNKIELFRRGQAPTGWDVWGNQTLAMVAP